MKRCLLIRLNLIMGVSIGIVLLLGRAGLLDVVHPFCSMWALLIPFAPILAALALYLIASSVAWLYANDSAGYLPIWIGTVALLPLFVWAYWAYKYQWEEELWGAHGGGSFYGGYRESVISMGLTALAIAYGIAVQWWLWKYNKLMRSGK